MNRITLARCLRNCAAFPQRNIEDCCWGKRMREKGALPMERAFSRYKLILLAFALIFASAGCEKVGSRTSAVDKPNPKQIAKPIEKTIGREPLKIGFSMDTLLEERWQKDRD